MLELGTTSAVPVPLNSQLAIGGWLLALGCCEFLSHPTFTFNLYFFPVLTVPSAFF